MRACRHPAEITGGDEGLHKPARQHWRLYKQQGYAVTAHNL